MIWDRRVEHIGNEGGKPPIFITWWKRDKMVGLYSLRALGEMPLLWGEMFQ